MRRRHLKFSTFYLIIHFYWIDSIIFIQSLIWLNHSHLIKLNSFEIIKNKHSKINIMITSFAEDVVFVSTRTKRIENAKQFLKENLIEIIACVFRIYDLIEIIFYNLIKR
jgi:hypothetical protein